jgi:hypothetical protein
MVAKFNSKTHLHKTGKKPEKNEKTYFINVSQNPILHCFQIWEAPFCQQKI